MTNAKAKKYIAERIDALDQWKGQFDAPLTSVEQVEALLNVQVQQGAADVAAVHDFYKLEIAFENVWEEIFGTNIADLGRSLYQNSVTQKDTAPTTEEIKTTEDIRQLVAERRALLDGHELVTSVPAYVRELLPEITLGQWASLTSTDQALIWELAVQFVFFRDYFERKRESGLRIEVGGPPDNMALAPGLDLGGSATLPAQSVPWMVEQARQILKNALESYVTVIEELSEALLEKHAFNVYVANTVNFGLLFNYRQVWKPLTYQVGELVNTIPLAPKEERKYTKKQTFKESRKRKEIENSLSINKGDTSQTSRADSEIVNRAKEKTVFDASADAHGSIGVIGFNGSTSLNVDSERESSRTKKNFREAVVKAAHELKNEHKLDIEFTRTSELEDVEIGTIFNPNEEICVSFLFYELQRRYSVSEFLNDVTPVILLANDVPNPDEIDEPWILRHEWILRRVLLDDGFLNALDLLKRTRTGEKMAIEVLRRNVQAHMQAFDDTKMGLETYVKSRRLAEGELRAAVDQHARALNADENTMDKVGSWASDLLSPDKVIKRGIMGPAYDLFFGASEEGEVVETPEAAQARQEAVEDALGRIDQAITETRSRLQGIATALDGATDKYNSAVRAQLNREQALMKLRVHIKDNILYYMQAIWGHEPADQRFFRICDVPVPTFGGLSTLNAEVTGTEEENVVELVMEPNFEPEGGESVSLKEVADLDNLLGFKGNYMIFPMTTDDHPITTFMMQDYLDKFGNTSDPDKSLLNVFQGVVGDRIWETLAVEARTKIVGPEEERLRAEFEAGNITQEEYEDAVEQEVTAVLQMIEILREEFHASMPDDEIVVPSDLLFIDALKGKHPILEDFKLMHRGIDMLKATVELEEEQVELIRHKARLLTDDLGDPDVDKRIQIEGQGAGLEIGID